MLVKSMKILIAVLLTLSVSDVFYAAPSQRPTKRRTVKNETRVLSLPSGGSITINNYVNCDGDNARGRLILDGKGGDLMEDNFKDCPLSSYSFPRGDQKTDYIRVKTAVPDMYSGSVCAWVSTGPRGMIQGTLLSYATVKQFNGLILYGYLKDNSTLFDIFINNDGYFTDLNLPKNRLAHLCVTFSVPGAYVKIFVDGILSHKIDGFKNKDPVEGGGVLIIGQEQDGLGSGFMEDQAYHGTVVNFMMWSRELTPNEIRKMADPSCQCPVEYFLSLTPESVMLMGGAGAKTILKCPGSK